MDYYAMQHGWEPLTEEEEAILDDAVRMVTNLDSKPRYASGQELPSSVTHSSEQPSFNHQNEYVMEERKFKNRRELADWVAERRGWGPLTEEDKIALDDAVRMVTNLDSRPRYAVHY